MTAPSDAPDARRTARLTPAMRWVLIGVGALVLVGAAIAIWLLTVGPGTGRAGADPTPTSTSTSKSETETETPGPAPGATPTTGSEVQSPDSEDSVGPGLPPIPTPTPLVTAPLPAPASAEGALADGYPAEIAGPSGGSDVLTSSIASEGNTMQVTLVARTDASADDVRAHYRDVWSGLGLAETASGDSAATSFGDTYTSLSLAFAPASGTGTVYMIYGVLRAG